MKENVRLALEDMEFAELRELIDDCISWNVESAREFITFDVTEISEYIDVLQSKFSPDPEETQPTLPDAPTKSRLQLVAERVRFEIVERLKKKRQVSKDQAELEMRFPVRFKYSLSKKGKALHLDLALFDGKQSHRHTCKSEETPVAEHESYIKLLSRHAEVLRSYHRSFRPRPHKISTKQSIVNRLRRDLASRNFRITRTKKLFWRLLPHGDDPFGRIQLYLQKARPFRTSAIDNNKIRRILSLSPTEVYSGLDEFEGYLVFYFTHKKKAVLDCPRTGNAIYVFGENWRELSKLTKSELLNYYPNKTLRIIHSGDWLSRLKWKLGFYDSLKGPSRRP